MVTIDYDQLVTQITDATGIPMLNGQYGPTPITPQTARRIACDTDTVTPPSIIWLIHHKNWQIWRDPVTKRIHVSRT
jgi:hypothetical protein